MKIVSRPVETEIEAKKSRFIAELCDVTSEEEAKAFLEEVRERYKDMKHHCYALRLGLSDTVYERFSDDGEPQGTAGKPILDVLRGEDLRNTICVVTRYFGGILLGTGGLVRAYSGAARETVKASELQELYKGTSFYIDIPYDMIGKIKHTAERSDIHIAKEEYGELCRLYFAMETGRYEGFRKAISDISLGKVEPKAVYEALCYDRQSPKVYKKLQM